MIFIKENKLSLTIMTKQRQIEKKQLIERKKFDWIDYLKIEPHYVIAEEFDLGQECLILIEYYLDKP